MKIEIDLENLWSVYPKKSKKLCAFCDKILGFPSKKEMKESKSRIFVGSVTLGNKQHKSKKIKLCGPCAQGLKQLKNEIFRTNALA